MPKTNRQKDNVRLLFDYIEKRPIIEKKRTANELKVSYNTVANVINKLQGLNILVETTNSARNKVFAYSEYLAILKKRYGLRNISALSLLDNFFRLCDII